MLGEEQKKKSHAVRWREAEQELLRLGIDPKDNSFRPMPRLPKVVETATVGLIKNHGPSLPPLLPS